MNLRSLGRSSCYHVPHVAEPLQILPTGQVKFSLTLSAFLTYVNANINLSSPTVEVSSVLWGNFKFCVLCYPQIHSSVPTSIWNQFPIDDVKSILFYTEAVTMQNLNNSEVQQEAIAVGKARCRLVGSHLSVLPAMVGSLYLLSQNNNKNTLLVAEIGKDVYKLNQMVNNITTAEIVSRMANYICICRQSPSSHPRDQSSLFQLLIEIYK